MILHEFLQQLIGAQRVKVIEIEGVVFWCPNRICLRLSQHLVVSRFLQESRELGQF